METVQGLPQVAALQIDLTEHKGVCLAGSRDLIHEHRVGAWTVMTALPNLARGANQVRPHDQLAGSLA
jgi:hypothetical protein